MPNPSTKIDVLVVGAGPSGLLAALELAQAGVSVEIIDRAPCPTARSCACGLHASSLERLGRLGLEASLLDAGIPIQTFSFHEGSEHRADLRVGGSPGASGRGLLSIPQDRLEAILEKAAHDRSIRVSWGYRLDDLHQDDHTVRATVEKLGLTSVGYPFARSEEMVEREIEVYAKFVIGADGAASHVRQVLGIPTRACGPAVSYEIFEFKPASPPQNTPVDEVRVAVGPGSLDTLWPLPGGGWRWSLQLDTPSSGEHPDKERSAFVVLNDVTDGAEHQRVDKHIRTRAPWFQAGIAEINWQTLIDYEPKVATRFGQDRCWLAGDAGHQTSPIGMQSMNVGLREAADLAQRIAKILRSGSSLDLLGEYNLQRLTEWSRLHGQAEFLIAGPRASGWAAGHRSRILPCIPESGAALVELAAQLGLGSSCANP